MPLFDPAAKAHARARARADARAPSFLDQRIWDELGERIAQLARPPRSALLLGPPTPAARATLDSLGIAALTDPDQAGEADLLLLVRWAELEEELAPALAALAHLAAPGTPLIGCALGGDSLAALRAALIEADRAAGPIAPRAHPRLDPAALAGLLGAAGFVHAVVDVERVHVRYSALGRLVGDLRDLGLTNQLADRPRAAPDKAWARRLENAFPPGTEEIFDLLHFAGWTIAR